MKLLHVTKLLTTHENIRKSQFSTSLLPNVRQELRARNYHWIGITVELEDSALRVMTLSFARQRGEMLRKAPGEARRSPKIIKISFFSKPTKSSFFQPSTSGLPGNLVISPRDDTL